MSLCVYINTWPLYTLEKFLVYFPEWIISPLIRSLSKISLYPNSPTLPLFIEYCLALAYNQILTLAFSLLKLGPLLEKEIIFRFWLFVYSILEFVLAAVYRKLLQYFSSFQSTWPSSTRFVTLTSNLFLVGSSLMRIMKFQSILTLRYIHYTLLRKDVTTATVLNT